MERLINVNELNLALCKNKEIPQAEDYIFDYELSPQKIINAPEELLNKTVYNSIWGICFEHGYITEQNNRWAFSNVHINLYITVELTNVVISVINAMRGEDVTVTLYHYDRDTNNYYSQEVM